MKYFVPVLSKDIFNVTLNILSSSRENLIILSYSFQRKCYDEVSKNNKIFVLFLFYQKENSFIIFNYNPNEM